MKNLKQKGITLIALVVTIVVLLILAGVTIAMLTGENGIINQAKNAKEESLKSELEELVDLTLMEYQTDKAVGKDTDLGELLNSKVGKDFDAVTEEEDCYIVEKNGYEVKVSKDGERLTDAEKVGGVRPQLELSKSYNEGTNKVTITVKITNKSELGTIDSFKLLDSGNEEVAEKTIGEDNKTFEVDKNGTYKAVVQATTEKVTKKASQSIVVDEFDETIKIQDKLGNIIYIPGGFKLANDSGENVENGIVIEDIKNGNQFVWIPVGEYKVSTTIAASGKLTNNLTRRQWGTEVNKTVTPTEVEGDVAVNGVGGEFFQGESSSISMFLSKAKEKSGFYIGRYEQGKGNVVKKNIGVYNNITRDNAKTQAQNLYSGNQYVGSELISSYAWDTALNFICQTNEEGYKLATVNSSEYGNLGNGTILKNTGMYNADKYNNIYDIFGNVVEWTTETSSYSGHPCVSRGSCCGDIYGFAGTRIRAVPSYSHTNNGFRTQLYIK